MIIGNGLIAKAFEQFKDDYTVFIFASGVSNSSETKKEEYDREIDLLKSYLHSQRKIVYISTASLFDPSAANSPYVLHKRRIENLITTTCKSYLIFRLPTVVGKTDNPHTFFNFFKNQILTKKEVSFNAYAHRYLIDADDITKILPLMIRKFDNKIINIAFNNKQSVCSILFSMKHELNSSVSLAPINDVKKVSNYIIDNTEFLNFTKGKFEIDAESYNDGLIKKYCK